MTTIVGGRARRLAARVFGPELGAEYLWARWLWLRALGLIFLSAFYSLAFQIHGLVGEQGILPAQEYLQQVRGAVPGLERFWLVPTMLWANASDRALGVLVGMGIVCSVLIVANLWPRGAIALCTLLFLSCVSALQDFSSYQSDGMLLEAGLISCFVAPRGLRPGLGAQHPAARASLFLLQWEWLRIYFESGVAKLASGDPHWRNFTAMDEYYQNGPLPAWPGWYVQHFPHAYHAATAFLTLFIELVVVWAAWLPRRVRITVFLAVTALQIGIIATANYAFLNYLVLALGVLLLDDRALAMVRFRTESGARVAIPASPGWRTWISAAVLSWLFYATVAEFIFTNRFATLPARLLEPFRVANSYGLFANMTEARYEIEFQGTRDGQHWVAYRFRYKPQDPAERPGIYAPYQPRFDWNLWFASLAPWRQSPWVVLAQMRLLENSPSVLRLLRSNPFPGSPPTQVRTVLWQYWFTDRATHRATGLWWRRELLGPFSGTAVRLPDGRMQLKNAP